MRVSINMTLEFSLIGIDILFQLTDYEGDISEIPRFLRCEGEIVNRRIGKRDCAVLVNDIWRERIRSKIEVNICTVVCISRFGISLFVPLLLFCMYSTSLFLSFLLVLQMLGWVSGWGGGGRRRTEVR